MISNNKTQRIKKRGKNHSFPLLKHHTFIVNYYFFMTSLFLRLLPYIDAPKGIAFVYEEHNIFALSLTATVIARNAVTKQSPFSLHFINKRLPRFSRNDGGNDNFLAMMNPVHQTTVILVRVVPSTRPVTQWMMSVSTR